MSRCLWILVCLASIGSFGRAAASRPNIVLIISDDHAWTDYGFMGHEHIKTPRLDRLAAQSRTFTRGYVPASLCCPSLASILTGRYPHQHKVVSNDPPRPAGVAPREFYKTEAFRAGREKLSSFIDQLPTLPRALREHGYVSFQSGKWWQNHFSRGGFTHGMTAGDADHGGRHGDKGLEIGRKTMQPIYDFVDEARASGKPFLVWYAPMLPHDPHTPPGRLLEKYEKVAPSIHVARYWAMVEWFDETCGQLLDFLKDRGLAENTIVAYVTDNGWIQNVDKPRFAPRSKQSPYDGGLRTPILLRWPGKIQPRKIEKPVSSIDLFPTLLQAAVGTQPGNLPGIDLLDDLAVTARDPVFGDCYTHDAVDLDRPASSLRWRWIVSEGWKLIVPEPPNESGAPELYRIMSDPHETKNIAASEPETLARLRQRLDAWWDPSRSR